VHSHPLELGLELPKWASEFSARPAERERQQRRRHGRGPRHGQPALRAWEKQALSARGFQECGGHSEYSVYTVRRCIGRGPGGSSEPPEPSVCFSPLRIPTGRRRHRRRLLPAPRLGRLEWSKKEHQTTFGFVYT
jgi:hypothetical protein